MAQKIAYLSLSGDNGTFVFDDITKPCATAQFAFDTCAADLVSNPSDTYIISILGGGNFAGVVLGNYAWTNAIQIASDGVSTNIGLINGDGKVGVWDGSGFWIIEPTAGQEVYIEALNSGINVGNVQSFGGSAFVNLSDQNVSNALQGGAITIIGFDSCGDVSNGTGGHDSNGYGTRNGDININVSTCGAVISGGNTSGCCTAYGTANIIIASGTTINGNITTDSTAYDNSPSAGNITLGSNVTVNGNVSANSYGAFSDGGAGEIIIGSNCTVGDVSSNASATGNGSANNITINSGCNVGNISANASSDSSLASQAGTITIIDSTYISASASISYGGKQNGVITISGNSSLSDSINGLVDISGLSASGGGSSAISLARMLNLPFFINI